MIGRWECLMAICLCILTVCNGQDYCGTTSFGNTSGVIQSPNYPLSYPSSSNCTYHVIAPSISNISLTIQFMQLEYQENCSYDMVQVRCRSHDVSTPTRFCGQQTDGQTIFISPCTDAMIEFTSDISANFPGFSIAYEVKNIECVRNCSPVSNNYGYTCPCDRNTSLPVSPSPPTCPLSKCILSGIGICYCHGSPSTPPPRSPPDSSSTTSSSSPPPSTTVSCDPGCDVVYSRIYNTYLCQCVGSTRESSIQSTSRMPCPSGCEPQTDVMGNGYCQCPVSTSTTMTSTMWCYQDCTRDINVYGNQYCRCPTTTYTPCNYPCYYQYDYSYGYEQRFCQCPPLTTQPPATGCNQTLTYASGYVTSPNYPNLYPRGIECTQTISVPRAASIRLRLIEINVYYSSDVACQYEYIEIFGCDGSYNILCTANNFPVGGLDFACTDSPVVTIKFQTYSGYVYSTNRGFKLAYSTTVGPGCGQSGYFLSQNNTGLILSPNYPNSFPPETECTSNIYAENDDTKIRIVFEQLNIGDASICDVLFLQFICQDDDVTQNKVCGSTIPSPLTFDCSIVQVYFKSKVSASLSPRNYRIRYFSVATTEKVSPSRSTQGQDDLSMSAKLGIGLGVGIGGFFLLVLIAIIILLIINGQKQIQQQQEFQMNDLNSTNNLTRKNKATDGFENPLHEGYSAESLPKQIHGDV